MKAATLFVFLIGLVSSINCKISFDKVESEVHPDLIKLSVRVEKNANDIGTLSLEADFLKDLDGQLKVATELSKRSNDKKTYQPVLTIPKMNFCEIGQKKKEFPIVGLVMDQLNQFGRIPLECPIKKGQYHLKELLLPDMVMPSAVFSSGKYRFVVKFTDEGASNPLVYTLTAYLTFDSGPGLGGLLG